MPSISDLLGDEVIAKGGAKVATSDFSGEGKVIGLYFSAHWCPPCRGFTPKLAEWYEKFKKSANGAKLEIIFVSSDRDDASFNEYFGEMPWHALPFDKRDLKTTLGEKFDVRGIPMLVFLDNDGNVITKDGRGHVMGNTDTPCLPTKK